MLSAASVSKRARAALVKVMEFDLRTPTLIFGRLRFVRQLVRHSVNTQVRYTDKPQHAHAVVDLLVVAAGRGIGPHLSIQRVKKRLGNYGLPSLASSVTDTVTAILSL